MINEIFRLNEMQGLDSHAIWTILFVITLLIEALGFAELVKVNYLLNIYLKNKN